MIYEFTCHDFNCVNYKKRINVHCSMEQIEGLVSLCKCGKPLSRVFSSFSFRGFGEDKYKPANTKDTNETDS